MKQQRPIAQFSIALSLALAAALGVQIAWWGWHFFAPSPRIEAIDTDTSSIDLSQARQLFGEVATNTAPAADNNTGIKLKGVYAVDGKTLSAAVVNTGARDMSVRVNEKITDAITLIAVSADHIIISRAGAREKIEIERNSKNNIVGAASAASMANAAPAANFRLNVASSSRNSFNLSRNELNTVLQDPRQINFLGGIAPAATGGVQISSAEPGTLAQKLGLNVGDIITSINGQPVNSAGDLARFYGQFGSTNTIRAEIKRGGAPVLLSYTINP